MPTLDHESAVIAAGWQFRGGLWCDPEGHDSDGYPYAAAVCKYEGIEPDECEIQEHWIVSRWLGGRLKEHGERVGLFGDLMVWGRTTTVQAIYMDEVIQEIIRNLYAEKD